MKDHNSQVYMMSSSYSIEMQYGPCSSLVSRPFLHVVEVSLTLVSYTHFLLVYMDVCGSTYGNGAWLMRCVLWQQIENYSLSVSWSAICGCPALIRAAQNVESRPTTLFC